MSGIRAGLQAVGSLELAATTVQYRLGVAVRLLGAFDHEWKAMLLSKFGASGRYNGSLAF